MNIEDLKKFFVSPESSLKNVIVALDNHGQHICLVVDDDKHLLGTITDGDIRRTILMGKALGHLARDIMNQNPRVAKEGIPREEILKMMTEQRITQLPLVNNKGQVVSLETMLTLAKEAYDKHANWVVLMAGGLGTRLRPLTNDVPKPLLEVAGKPILEKIIENCAQQHFKKFYISVNYKAEMIMDYFGNGEKLGVEIHYLHETERMGTAGALSLIDDVPTEPLFVMNADLVTDVSLSKMLVYHNESHADVTMGVREYDFQVPFGVVQTQDHKVVCIEEKPVHQFFVNAGIYIINPEIIKHIASDAFTDMPDLLSKQVQNGKNVSAFPVIERWIDIGRLDDFQRAQNGE